MFIKNILKAFDRDTLIEVYWMGKVETNYPTVGKFMDSGLMTYVEVDEQRPLYIENNKIIIYLKDVF